MVNVFDKDTHKIRFVKTYEGLPVDTFCTLEGFKQVEFCDSQFNGCVIFGVPEPRVVSLEEIKYHQKYHSKLAWSDLEVILENNNVKEVVAIVKDSPIKEAMIIDTIESSQKIYCVRQMK